MIYFSYIFVKMGRKMTNSSLKAVPLAFVLFFSCFFVCAEPSLENESSAMEIVQSDSQVSGQPEFRWSSQSDEPTENSPSTFFLFLKMILSLAVVIALAYGIFFLLRRGSKTVSSDDPFLRSVARLVLAPGKSVEVVTVLDHAYILGVSENSVSLVGEISDKELVDSMNLYADKNSEKKKPRSFADVLALFMPNGPRDGSVFESSAKNAADMLRRQRERFNDEEQM